MRWKDELEARTRTHSVHEVLLARKMLNDVTGNSVIGNSAARRRFLPPHALPPSPTSSVLPAVNDTTSASARELAG